MSIHEHLELFPGHGYQLVEQFQLRLGWTEPAAADDADLIREHLHFVHVQDDDAVAFAADQPHSVVCAIDCDAEGAL